MTMYSTYEDIFSLYGILIKMYENMYHVFISQYKYTVNITCRHVGCRGPAKLIKAQKPKNTQHRYDKKKNWEKNLVTVRPISFR